MPYHDEFIIAQAEGYSPEYMDIRKGQNRIIYLCMSLNYKAQLIATKYTYIVVVEDSSPDALIHRIYRKKK